MTVATYGNPLWIGPLASATGFAEEGRGFVCSLRRLGVPLAAMPVEREASTFLSELARDFPEQIVLLNEAVGHRPSGPATAIVHTPAASIPAPPDGVAYAVCRTMWETDGLDPEQVARLNTYDEIWVPSTFNVETFTRAGVRAPLVVVPEGVDSNVFRPGVAHLRLAGLRRTVFLSMFEWSHRKAPDVLLRAWARAFAPSDDVTLLLRCYPRDQHGNTTDLTDAIDVLVDRTLALDGLSRADVAPIVVLGQRLTPGQLPALYAAADCYVAPARGEGWGRPLMEAMSTALPVIATRWSAPLDFLTDDNALLVDVEGLELIDDRMDVPTYRGQRWAAPSTTRLTELLVSIVDDPGRSRRLGRQARRDVVQRWQWHHVGGIAAAELERIQRNAHGAPAQPSPAPRAVRNAGPASAERAASPGLCAVVTRSYLPWARVLAASLAEHHPEIRPTVLVVDGDVDARTEPFEVIGVSALGVPAEQLATMALIYTPTELSCALKPWVLDWVLRRSPTAIYLDSDVVVGRRLDDAFALAAEHGIVLTPHVLHPMPRDGRTPDETDLLASGMFNLGFIAVGPGSEAFLAFWKERLIDDGIIDQAHMRQADQRWVDFVPGCFRHHVWLDPAANVAYWNLHERTLSEDGQGRTLVDEQPLAFFHFSGFDPGVPGRLSRYQGARPRVALSDNPALARLSERYRAALLAAGYRRASLEPYGFGRLPSGELLTPERRRAYRTKLMPPSPGVPAAAVRATVAATSTARRRSSPPLVSVVVPTRDRHDLLSQALRSVLDQTYEHLELLVLDDGSTDATPSLLADVARREPRIHVVRAERPVGWLENHRRGLALARGSFVKLLHDDDRLLPEALDRLVAALEEHPGAAMATSARIQTDVGGQPRPDQPPSLGERDGLLSGREVADLMLGHGVNYVGEPSTVLFRRALLEPSSYATYAGRPYHWLSDVATWLGLLARGALAYVATPLSETRIHDGQLGKALGKVSEQAEWLDILEPARAAGLLAGPGAYEQALASILPRLLAAGLSAGTSGVAEVSRLLHEGLEAFASAGASRSGHVEADATSREVNAAVMASIS